MKKILLTLVAITFMSFNTLMADEGMWLPYSLNGQNLAQMQALGCKLTADQIFDLNKPSLKDAIVQFGGGCTGELISPNGLLLTNHHCGIGQVQAHSSLEHDYLTDGFWAYELKEELANPGLRVSFLSYVEDVTEVILKNITDEMDEETREKQIADVIKNTVSNKKGDRNVRVQIIPFYHGNQYILFEYDVYEDVRLVACPPWGIGKYGADTDNWTWPRHKGDFCIFRVYTAPDGSPATYSEENIPLKSKHHLPISLKGIEEGDYAMILGYPGSTDRYSSSQNVKLITDYQGPSLVKCRTTKLDVYRKHMDADPEVFIQYASKQAGVSNYWKYYIGQVKQLKRNKVVEKKETTEAEFTKWINQNAQRKEKYGNVLNDFQLRYEVMSKYQSALTYHIEAGLRGGEAIANSMNYIRVNNLIKEKNDYASLIERLRASSVDFFKNYNVDLDRDASIALLNLFYQDIPKELLPELIAKIGDKNNGDFTKYINKAFEKSVFTSQERLNAWFNNPKNLDKDPLFAILTSIRDSYFDILTLTNESSIVESKAARLYMQALMEMYPEKNFYPDANFTMRLTYGSVASYEPADVITYDFVSTMEGVMEKYIPGNWEFGLPNDLIELYNKKDYGEYADKDGQMIVNFITTNDITGGNSGSPVLDGEGNLIGLAFDGNWEAMSGDISFEQKVQRTISVDARFILFVIEKLGKAQNLIDEMTIIR